MHKADQLYDFRLAKPEDIDSIMDFYKREWHKDHILANDKEFFCYQHLIENRVNYMLAINRESGEIEAAEGFIQYSERLIDIGPVMWKVSSSSRFPLLGIELVRRMWRATNCRSYIGFASNPATALVIQEKVFKLKPGKTDHYYILSDRDNYNIPVIIQKRFNPINSDSNVRLRQIYRIEDLAGKLDLNSSQRKKPFKDWWYINKRYFRHPIYEYKIYAACNHDSDTEIKAVIVAREVRQNNSVILRIVDVIGDTRIISHTGQELKLLLQENDYEYIDIYCFGLDKKIFTEAGFVHKGDDDPNIIPNYFEPFVQKNIDIWAAIPEGEVILFKADGDQDRPNYSL